MKCRIELVFLLQCSVVSPKVLSLDSTLGFLLALNQKSGVLSVISILAGHYHKTISQKRENEKGEVSAFVFFW